MMVPFKFHMTLVDDCTAVQFAVKQSVTCNTITSSVVGGIPSPQTLRLL